MDIVCSRQPIEFRKPWFCAGKFFHSEWGFTGICLPGGAHTQKCRITNRTHPPLKMRTGYLLLDLGLGLDPGLDFLLSPLGRNFDCRTNSGGFFIKESSGWIQSSLCPSFFSMFGNRKESSSQAKLMEVPSAPARPVLPIRCT